MAGSVDVLIAADAGDRRLDADAVDGLDALGAHGKRDVPLQGRHPVPLGLQVRGEGSACFPVRVGDAVADPGACSQNLTCFGQACNYIIMITIIKSERLS